MTAKNPSPYPDSYYAASANEVADTFCATLDAGTLRCDVCVIGGGFTGLSCALHLAQAGYDTVLLEANRLGWGS